MKLQNANDSTPRISFDGYSIKLADIRRIARREGMTFIPENVRRRIVESRAAFERIVAENNPIYGVTTGYGDMTNIWIDRRHESLLQHNLVKSHAAGVGESFTRRDVRAIMAARLNALVRGHSGVSEDIIDRLAYFLDEDIVPIVPQIGSLGASGDLATLAHVAAALIGEGHVFDEERGTIPAAQAIVRHGLTPLTLKCKEGLALINGTSGMSGVGALLLERSVRQLQQAEAVSSLVIEAQRASRSPFEAAGHVIKPHLGQIETARVIRRMTEGSRLTKSHEELQDQMMSACDRSESVSATGVYIQNGYSLRCIPQVHGAIRDTLNYAKMVVETELNSSNDNPLLVDGGLLFHGGNFHGQAVAFVMDFVAIAMTQLGVMAERRINRMLNRHLNQGFPAFLIAQTPGLNCGFAGAQYPATALVAENRTICSPASIQSIPSNMDNQDIVSMGLIAARNASRIVENNYNIIAIEYLCAAQSIDIMDLQKDLSRCGRQMYDLIRSHVPKLDDDIFMSDQIQKATELLRNDAVFEIVESYINVESDEAAKTK